MDKILVVDDERVTLKFTEQILESAGYEVVTANNGDEALVKAEEEAPDLILLDVVMPGKSGLEVCKILKSQTKTKFIPVVMFTILGRDIDKKMSLEHGADGFFTKPFSPEKLLREVKRHLDAAKKSVFSSQLGMKHEQIKGKKILLEFDPSTPYERFVRAFAMEALYNGESVVVVTRRGSAVHKALEGDNGIRFSYISYTAGQAWLPLWFKTILETRSKEHLTVVYDNITNVALAMREGKSIYEFTLGTLEKLSSSNITAMLLVNSVAHEEKELAGLRALFSNILNYGRQGAKIVKFERKPSVEFSDRIDVTKCIEDTRKSGVFGH